MTKNRIGTDEVAQLLGAMVAIPSINPAFQKSGLPTEWFGEAKLADFIAGWLRNEGIEVWMEEVLPGRPNVVARLPAAADAVSMIWEGHTDTVQVEGMDKPFEPRLENGRLHGRGAVDDKGCLAMFMLAMRELRRNGCACDLTFVAAIDEETTFEGVLHHVRARPVYDLGIAGEPTMLALVNACKGVIRWQIEVDGRASHASKPEEGVDALLAAADLVRHLRDYMSSHERNHKTLERRTLTCTMMQAGEGPNTVPSKAVLTFDLRTLPDQTGEEAWTEIKVVVDEFAARYPSDTQITMHRPYIDSVSMEVPPDARIVTALSRLLQDYGLPHEPIGVPFGSDATKFTRSGTPTVVFGPGDIAQAHARDEYVEIDQIIRGSEILITLARSFTRLDPLIREGCVS
ncbi:M20 family metallopeptidase [Ochrobactrum teleogrylli]|uniref:M20/M25/M40 family metallo-hydrolase n=1 Tax=Ochrobactrum teleogrylli TaxID=2479765 RepID=A0ABD5K0S0_9HYPH